MRTASTLFCLGMALLIPSASRAQPVSFTIGGGDSVAAESGSLTVPANRKAGGTTTITLRFVRFRSTAATPGAPIVFLAGGPGDAATRAFHGMPRAMLERLRAIADVIAFDQRGTGTSEPKALCPPGEMAPLDRPLDPDRLLTSMKERLAICLPQLKSAGVDVSGLTTEESADDVEALRVTLGAPTVALLAGSYGTHLALAVARRHPDAVARMALLGVEGPDDTIKLPADVDAALGRVDERHPGLSRSIRTLIERLQREPWTKTLPNGQRVTVGVWDLQRRVADVLDTLPEIDALPAAVATMMDGDFSDVIRWAIPFRLAKPIDVMHVAMDCASFASAARLAEVDRQAPSAILGSAINFPLPGLCDAPGLPRLPDAFRSSISSQVPALFVAGSLDGRTPPSNAERIAKGFANGDVLVVPGASHSLFRDPAAIEAALAFLARTK